MYPEIKIDRIKKPNRWYAIPLFGFGFKLLIVFPVAIELWFLGVAQFFISILNACNIFFRGRYWKMAYELNLGIMRLETNVSFFLWGLTDTYPGFSLDTTNYDLHIDFNKKPNRIFATPLLGMIFRFVLLIPYIIYRQVLSLAAFLAIFVSWAWVLFAGRYPDTTYEIARDSIRVDQATSAYFLGLSDSYPSWWMSLNHKPLKIVLLAIAAFLTLWSFLGNRGTQNSQNQFQKSYYMQRVQESPPSFPQQY